MNIDAVKQEAEHDDSPVDVNVRDLSGEPYAAKDGSPTIFVVVGQYSKRYRANERPLANRRLQESRLNDDEVDADELDRRVAERIACGVIDWRGVETVDGAPIAFSQKSCVELLLSAPWVAKQVDKAIRGHARFFARASSS